MRRRILIASLGSTVLEAARAAAQGKQKQKQVVGFLGATSPETLQTSLIAFH
jgi:hypothetical protein